MSKKLFFLFIGISSSFLAMESNKEETYKSIILPGQNGLGGEHFKANNIIVTKNYKFFTTLGILSRIDMGQDNCIEHFNDQLETDCSNDKSKRWFYGISQGTATLVNYLGSKPKDEQEKVASGLVLESVLGTGDSAILHTAHSMVPGITYLPFSRILFPCIAKKFLFPAYNLSGKQALLSARALSPKIPVVIMHNKSDFQLSINDARQLYCILREQGNDHAYLFETNSDQPVHLNIWSYDPENREKKRALENIYKKYGLITSDATEIKIDSKFQPTIEEVQKRIAVSARKTRYIRNTVDTISISLICYGLYKFIYKYF